MSTLDTALDSGSTQLRRQMAAIEWVGTGPITRITIAAGSAVRLYKLTTQPPTPDYGDLVNAVDDAAAGVAVGELYRNGSIVMVRVA